jgi:hypothetical protein
MRQRHEQQTILACNASDPKCPGRAYRRLHCYRRPFRLDDSQEFGGLDAAAQSNRRYRACRGPADRHDLGHFALGTVAWGIIYAALQASLPGAPVVKGLIFGALAWLVMMIIFMPLAGHGLFALSLGPQATVATLVLHLIYGAVLGVAYAKVAHE